ncbi:glycoside hydrolase [Pseudaminobacter sp. 19-2017]|uniref:Glycoside hydrolase n=1 Tax=Pseudaminobacter soli (ex Zhang et al. 2022) TaxID=2831468 RepID=A0A942EBX9_9HYPH|nr:glycoside hydrolase [Pseudaminobacter soli]MBS3652317.1 glycoside hydrolase [Pseudaminobacter soli]
MFRSFFLAGFEGSTGYNRHREWFDQVVATGHDKTVEQDYRNLSELGIHAARETVRWPLVDMGRGRYDFSSLEPFVESARRNQVDVIWDLFHYGYPEGLDLFGKGFVPRFADYCYAVGRYIGVRTEGACLFTPVNEPSFMAYAGGEKGLFAPYIEGRGWDLKVQLCRAALAGIEALWSACPDARMVNVDPICRVAVNSDRPLDTAEAQDFNERLVFQAWDMIAGRLLPELGGSRRHLDVVGINYYWTNQWEWGATALPDGRIPPLADDDPRRLGIGELTRMVWQRYGGEVMISETSHVGHSRAPWLLEVALESEKLLRQGVPLMGVCLYPILGMPEWHEPEVWTPMGLWDPICHREPDGGRLICEPMLEALQSVQHLNDLQEAAQNGEIDHQEGPPNDKRPIPFRPRKRAVATGFPFRAVRQKY